MKKVESTLKNTEEKKNMSAMNVAINGHEAMEEVALMATLLVSYAISMTIINAMTPVNLATCAISTTAKGQLMTKKNVNILN